MWHTSPQLQRSWRIRPLRTRLARLRVIWRGWRHRYKRKFKWIESKACLRMLLWRTWVVRSRSAKVFWRWSLRDKIRKTNLPSTRHLKKRLNRCLSLPINSLTRKITSRSTRRFRSTTIWRIHVSSSTRNATKCRTWPCLSLTKFGRRLFAYRTIFFPMATSVAWPRPARFLTIASSIGSYLPTTALMVTSWQKSSLEWLNWEISSRWSTSRTAWIKIHCWL